MQPRESALRGRSVAKARETHIGAGQIEPTPARRAAWGAFCYRVRHLHSFVSAL